MFIFPPSGNTRDFYSFPSILFEASFFPIDDKVFPSFAAVFSGE
jgi:hypothetical protein